MRARGFTLLEFTVCMALVASLAGALLLRMAQYQRASERAAAHSLIGAVRTAMSVRAALLGATRGEAGIVALMQENPFRWLVRPPENYQGEYYRPRDGLIKEGHWYFDRSDRSINYLQRSDTFSSEIPKLLKFKVELLREPDPHRIVGRRQAEQGLMLAQVSGKAVSEDH